MAIEIIAGTNREGSRTLRLAKSLQSLYRSKGAEVNLLDLRDLPPSLFTPDAYDQKPSAFKPFADRVLAADGLVLVVPEYNGGFPGVLKLFIDMLPFPESFEGKRVAFVGLAAGYFGGLRAIEQLQMIFAYRNAKQCSQRVFIPKAAKEISDGGELLNETTISRLATQADHFIAFCHSE